MATSTIRKALTFDDPVTEPPATEEQIDQFEATLDITLPESFKELLRQSNGGEFCFARIAAPFIPPNIAELDSEDVWADLTAGVLPKHPLLEENLLLPFGDDYNDNYYCFDLQNSDVTDCPVVLLDASMAEDDDPELQAESFLELVEAAMLDP